MTAEALRRGTGGIMTAEALRAASDSSEYNGGFAGLCELAETMEEGEYIFHYDDDTRESKMPSWLGDDQAHELHAILLARDLDFECDYVGWRVIAPWPR